MKLYTLICHLLVLTTGLSIATPGFAQSQADLNRNQSQTLQQADKELNVVYQQILKQYRSDAAFVKNLKEAQRIWIQFREAEVRMKYPDRPAGYYGSAQPMCEASYRTELTQQRTKTLRIWLKGMTEGDVCAGSVQTNP